MVVGIPFSAQSQLGMETLVGQCANILPLRVKLESSEPFTHILKQAWSSLLDAQENWTFSFGRLIPEFDRYNLTARI